MAAHVHLAFSIGSLRHSCRGFLFLEPGKHLEVRAGRLDVWSWCVCVCVCMCVCVLGGWKFGSGYMCVCWKVGSLVLHLCVCVCVAKAGTWVWAKTARVPHCPPCLFLPLPSSHLPRMGCGSFHPVSCSYDRHGGLGTLQSQSKLQVRGDLLHPRPPSQGY